MLERHHVVGTGVRRPMRIELDDGRGFPMKRILTVALCLLTAVACGGGGSDGGVVGGGSTTLTVTYSPANANPGPDSVSLAQGTIQTNLITLDVLVTDAQGVYGAGFDLSYNSSSLTFVGYSPGTILESGGNSPSYQVSAPSPGDLVVGVSRTGQVPGVDVSGTQTLVRLTPPEPKFEFRSASNRGATNLVGMPGTGSREGEQPRETPAPGAERGPPSIPGSALFPAVDRGNAVRHSHH